MKTMQKLCRQFERLFPEYCAELDEMESHKGYYRVCIIDLHNNLWSWHIFTSCMDFSEWMHGVVLD